MKQKKPVVILISVVLMMLLGIARGLGGVVLIINGKEAVPESALSQSVMTVLGILLLVICVLEIVAAVGVYVLNKKMWYAGIITTILFLFDGMLNGYLLYGSPQAPGTAANFVYALIIIAFLLLSRKYFVSGAEETTD